MMDSQSNNDLISLLIEAAVGGDSISVQKELFKLLRIILGKYPSKPTEYNEYNKEAQDDHLLINSIFYRFDDLLAERSKSKIAKEGKFAFKNTQLVKHFENEELVELILLGTSKYLAWDDPESYDQKDLLSAIEDCESKRASSVFSQPPKWHFIKVHLTIKDFVDKCVAITCISRMYEAKTKKYRMTVVPEYGYKPELEGKTFDIIFEDCIRIEEEKKVVNDDFKSDEELEIISWGEDVGEEKIKLLTELGLQNENEFKWYYFTNLFTTNISILCKKVTLHEII